MVDRNKLSQGFNLPQNLLAIKLSMLVYLSMISILKGNFLIEKIHQ